MDIISVTAELSSSTDGKKIEARAEPVIKLALFVT